MWAYFLKFSAVPWAMFALSYWAMDTVPVVTLGQPEVHVSGAVHDHGRLFGREARRRVRSALRRIQRDHGVQVVIETFESLGGRDIDEVARRRPRPLGDDGIYVLMAGDERDVAVRLFRDESGGRNPILDRAAIREAFLAPLRSGDVDGALEGGIRAVDVMLGNSVEPRPRSDRGVASVAALAALAGVLASLWAMRSWGRDRGGSRRRRGADVGFVMAGPSGRIDPGRSPAVQAPRVGTSRAQVAGQ